MNHWHLQMWGSESECKHSELFMCTSFLYSDGVCLFLGSVFDIQTASARNVMFYWYVSYSPPIYNMRVIHLSLKQYDKELLKGRMKGNTLYYRTSDWINSTLIHLYTYILCAVYLPLRY